MVTTQEKPRFASPQIVVSLKNHGLTILGMDYPEEIGRRIRNLRDEKTWSLAELSRRTKDVLSRKRIQNYEAGVRTPGPAEAVILAKALGTRPAYIMAIDDVQTPITSQEESMVKFWRKLSEKDRMSYYRQLETLAMQNADPAADDRVARAVGKPPEVATKKKRKTVSERRP